MGSKEYKSIIKVVLPAIFLMHLFLTLSFSHVHITNGKAIVHSHPYNKECEDGQEHSHTTAELEIIYFLSFIQATTQIVYSITIGFSCLYCVKLFSNPCLNTFINHIKESLRLRAPPVNILSFINSNIIN